MRLDKCQVCPSDFSLDTGNDRSNRPIPCLFTRDFGSGVRRLDTLDVDWVVRDSFLSFIDQRVDIGFEDFGIVDVGRVT